mgnify:FL=1
MHKRNGTYVKGHLRNGCWVRPHARTGSSVHDSQHALNATPPTTNFAYSYRPTQFENTQAPHWFTEKLEDVCGSAACPLCGASVFFVRHNGGSVWLDDLGWLWPRHSCFADPEPRWMSYFRQYAPNRDLCKTDQSGTDLRLGVVVKVAERAVGVALIAFVFGNQHTACLAVEWTDKIQPRVGFAGVLDMPCRTLTLSTYQQYKVLQGDVPPTELGLPADWSNTKLEN